MLLEGPSAAEPSGPDGGGPRALDRGSRCSGSIVPPGLSISSTLSPGWGGLGHAVPNRPRRELRPGIPAAGNASGASANRSAGSSSMRRGASDGPSASELEPSSPSGLWEARADGAPASRPLSRRAGGSALDAFATLLAGVVTLSAVLLAAPSAHAGELDLRAWLDRPGVKLLAVEFYATWCKPCMDAVPKWKALHERFRKDGLRLIVVATRDPEAGCSSPGWTPDEVICDDEGILADRMGASNLPAAFLWSWQGTLLTRGGHVEEVEATIEKWMYAAPRVDVRVSGVAPRSGIGETALQDLVRSELSRSDKLVVVATAEERAALAELKRAAYSERFDEKTRCEIGKELPPNALLDVQVLGAGSRRNLSLRLLEASRGCLVGNALVGWNPDRPQVSVAEAVAELFQKLRPAIQMPRGRALTFSGPGSGGQRPAPAEVDIGERFEAWNPQLREERVIVSFVSEPTGAVVLLNGDLLCQNTERGCSRDVVKGRHTVTMQRERYKRRTETLTIDRETELRWTLEPDFGVVSVHSLPPGLELKVNGRAVGNTPIERLELDPGAHELLISDPCYFDQGKRINIRAGESRRLDFEVPARMGALDLVAVDEAGNARRGDIYIDGAPLGSVPGVIKVPICARKLEIRRGSSVLFETDLAIKERKLVSLRALIAERPLNGARGAVPSVRSRALFYADPRVVDYRPEATDSEAAGLLDALRLSGREVSLVADLRGRALRRALDGQEVIVLPDLERSRPRLDRSGAALLRSFVEKGGVLLTSLDESGQDRAQSFLQSLFGWRLEVKGNPEGKVSRKTSEASRLGLRGPAALDHVFDCDALFRSRLPPGSRILYADGAGDGTVTLIPHGAGFVLVLGWDWYDGAPRGKQDGGWLAALGAVLDLSWTPAPAAPAPQGVSRPAGPREPLAFVNDPRFADFRPQNREAEGSNLEATLRRLGYPLKNMYLGALGDLPRSDRVKAVVVPELEKGSLRELAVAFRAARRGLKKYVASGGRLVMLLDSPDQHRFAEILASTFRWRGLQTRAQQGSLGSLNVEAARALGIAGLPTHIERNNDTDVILKTSLPRNAHILYADEAGDALVSVLPYRNGQVLILGWDWYEAVPTGARDGGWLQVLDALLR